MRKLLFIVCLVSLCIFISTVGVASAGETKQFKFFDFGVYTVPEDFPDKFLSFESWILAYDSLVDGKGQLVLVEYRFSGSPGHFLIVGVVGYLIPNQDPVIVCIKTISTNNNVPKNKPTIVEYADVQMFDTGRSSRVLVKVTKPLNLQKFIDERIADLKRQEI